MVKLWFSLLNLLSTPILSTAEPLSFRTSHVNISATSSAFMMLSAVFIFQKFLISLSMLLSSVLITVYSAFTDDHMACRLLHRQIHTEI